MRGEGGMVYVRTGRGDAHDGGRRGAAAANAAYAPAPGRRSCAHTERDEAAADASPASALCPAFDGASAAASGASGASVASVAAPAGFAAGGDPRAADLLAKCV